jgi:outer membrane protein assembly factor BamB
VFEDALPVGEFMTEMAEYDMQKVKKFERIWRVGYGGSISSTPLYYNGVIYFGCADQFVYALDPADGRMRWKFKTEGGIILSYVKEYNGLIYFGSFDHNMYAITAEGGKLVWKYKTFDKIASTPAFSDGVVYFGGKDHFVYALRADTGQLVWKYKTFDCIISEPAVVGDRLLIVSYDRNLYCLNKNTGELIWRFETQGEIHNPSKLAVKDGVVYFNSFDNYLRAVDIENGKLIWKKLLGQYGCEGTATIHGDVIYNAARNGVLYAVSTDGELLWKFVTREVPGEPCVHGDKLYIGGGDFFMYCLSLAGKELWRFKTQGYVWHQNIKVGKNLVFGSWDCNLYCVDADTGQLVWKFGTGGSPCPVPPTYEGYEMRIRLPVAQAEDGDSRKTYDLDLPDEELGTSAYKSRITYQISTHYAEKGKYQVDSDEEAF